MKNKNINIIDFRELKSQIFTIDNSYAKVTIKGSSRSFMIEMECNLNWDVNLAVGTEYPKETADDFIPCIEAFGDRRIVSFYDESQNIELEVGYDISRELEIFFEIVDYDYDPDQGVKPTTYTLYVDDANENYDVLKELIDFMRKQREKEGLGENHENRSDTVEYKRPSGL